MIFFFFFPCILYAYWQIDVSGQSTVQPAKKCCRHNFVSSPRYVVVNKFRGCVGRLSGIRKSALCVHEAPEERELCGR